MCNPIQSKILEHKALKKWGTNTGVKKKRMDWSKSRREKIGRNENNVFHKCDYMEKKISRYIQVKDQNDAWHSPKFWTIT